MLANLFPGFRQLSKMGALPWFGGIALAAFLAGVAAGAYPAYKLTRNHFERATLKAQLNLSNFTAELASNAAKGEQEAARRQQEALQAISARNDAVTALVAQIPAMVAKRLQPDLATLRSILHADPELEACLARPYPPDALRLLRREGGAIAAPNH